MNKITLCLAILVILLAIAACAPARSESQVKGDGLVIIGPGLYRAIDHKAKVACWYASTGGVYCLSLEETELSR